MLQASRLAESAGDSGEGLVGKFIDDSPMKVLDRSEIRNIKLGRVWIYRGDEDHPFNLFDYTTSRGRDDPLTFLRGFKGYLMGDCFSGNQALCKETGATHVACNAHARRYYLRRQ